MGVTNNSGIPSPNVSRLVDQGPEGRQSGQVSRKFLGRAISTTSVDSGFIDLKSQASSRPSSRTSLSSRSLTSIEPKPNYIKKETSGSATLDTIFHKVLSNSDPRAVSKGIDEFLSGIKDECKSKGYSSEYRPSSKESSKKYHQLVEMVAHESLLTQTHRIGDKTSTIDQVVQHAMDIVQSQRLRVEAPENLPLSTSETADGKAPSGAAGKFCTASPLIKMHDYDMQKSFTSTLIKVGSFSREDQKLIYDVGLNLDCFSIDERVESLPI